MYNFERAIISIAKSTVKNFKNTENSITLSESAKLVLNYFGFKDLFHLKKYINETDLKDLYIFFDIDFYHDPTLNEKHQNCIDYINECLNVPPFICEKKLLQGSRPIDHIVLNTKKDIRKFSPGSTEYVFPGFYRLYLRKNIPTIIEDRTNNDIYRQVEGVYTTNFTLDIFTISSRKDEPNRQIEILKRFLDYIYNINPKFTIIFRDTDVSEVIEDYMKNNKDIFLKVPFSNIHPETCYFWNYKSSKMILESEVKEAGNE